MNKIIYFVLLFLFLSPTIISLNAESEKFDSVYMDKRSFDILDVCNKYISFNDSGTDITKTFGTSFIERNIVSSNLSINPTTPAKPSKLIKWEDNGNDQLILVSKLLYNWTDSDTITINLFYNSSVGNSKEDINVFFKDYHDESRPSNLIRQYGAYDKTKYEWESSSQQTQSSMNRMSEIDNAQSFSTGSRFNIYTKYEGNASFTEWKVRNAYVSDERSINTEKWISVIIKPNDLVFGGILYNYNDFLNIGISKANIEDVVYVNSIKVTRKSIDDEINKIPCLEYYEFNEITTFSNTTYFNIDFVLDDYDSLEVLSYNLSLVVVGPTVYLRNYVNNTIRYDAFNSAVPGSPFLGYQVNVQKSLEDSTYKIYFNFKYGSNVRSVLGVITYSYKTVIFSLDANIKYILDVQYYDELSETDAKLEFTEMSHKWDQLDNAFTVIDSDAKGDTLLIKDIDNSGFRFPSLNDIKKVILSAFKPLFELLTAIANLVIVPLLEILGLMDGILSIVSGISGFIDLILDSVSAIEPVIDFIFDAVDGLEAFVDTINTNLNLVWGIITDVFNIITDLLDLLSAISTGALTAFQNFIVFGIQFIIDAIELSIALITIVLSIIALTFMYTLIMKINNFNQSGDLNDLFEIALVFEKIAMFIYGLFMGIWSLIASIIPG